MGAARPERRPPPPRRPWRARVNLMWLAVRRAERFLEKRAFGEEQIESWIGRQGGQRSDKIIVDVAIGDLGIWTGLGVLVAAPFAFMASEAGQPWSGIWFAAALAIGFIPAMTAMVLVVFVWLSRRRLPPGGRNRSLYMLYGHDRELMWKGTKVAAMIAAGVAVVTAAVVDS